MFYFGIWRIFRSTIVCLSGEAATDINVPLLFPSELDNGHCDLLVEENEELPIFQLSFCFRGKLCRKYVVFIVYSSSMLLFYQI
jgi:hypothetical protein